MERSIQDGKMGGNQWSSGVSKKVKDAIYGDVRVAHLSRTNAMLDFLLGYMGEVWTKEGQADFYTYFQRMFGAEMWRNWSIAAVIIKGVLSDQNMIEIAHAVQKRLIPKGDMRAPT